MPNIGVISLNGGKFTPLIDVRSDVEKYSSGCRIVDNMIPLVYGPMERRPGTKKIADVEDHDVKSKMFPFIFSSTIAYKAEFSNQIINMYFKESSVHLGIVSPYLEADLFQIQTEQSADVMWIVHPSHAPRKLSRTSAEVFSLDTILFNKGPFIERNDIAKNNDVTITVTGYSEDITATAGAKNTGKFTFTSATNIASLFPPNKRFYITNSTGNDGAFTVHDSTTTYATDYAGTTITIYTNETVADGTDDGQIMVNGGTVTLTASSATFNKDGDHNGALFKLTHKRLQSTVKGSKSGTDTGVIDQSIDVKGNFTLTTHENWDKTIELQRLEDGTNWEVFRSYTSVITNGVGSRQVQKAHVEESDNVQYRINVVSATSGTITADIAVDKSTQDSIFRITATTSATSVTAVAIVAAPDNTATKRWAEGAWSKVRGYPSAVAFFGERIVYGFTNSDQQNIWLSEVGKFEDFEAGIKDSDAFTLTLPTANRGRWLSSLEALAVGTSGNEWRVKAPLDEALTPTNWDIKEQTARGSADIQAIKVNEAILFVDFVARKIREFTFSESSQKFVAPDLTALAEDITSGGITSVAVQKNPDSIIWFTIANSPYLISMTYEREQNVVAFAEHPLGRSGVAESVCVTPGTSEDIITLTAKWTIDGSTKRYILDMQPRDWGSITSAADSFFVDAGIVDTGGTTTITNLNHLEGELVSVLVDGAVQASKTVSGGSITIEETGARVVVGIPYTWQVSPMRPDIVTRGGTTHGSIMIVPEIVLSLFASGGVEYGDGANQKAIDFRTTEEYGSPPELFTGDTDALAFDGGFTKDVNIVISGNSPLPCTVRAIILRLRKAGR